MRSPFAASAQRGRTSLSRLSSPQPTTIKGIVVALKTSLTVFTNSSTGLFWASGCAPAKRRQIKSALNSFSHFRAQSAGLLSTLPIACLRLPGQSSGSRSNISIAITGRLGIFPSANKKGSHSSPAHLTTDARLPPSSFVAPLTTLPTAFDHFSFTNSRAIYSSSPGFFLRILIRRQNFIQYLLYF